MKINNNQGPSGINPYIQKKAKVGKTEFNQRTKADKVEISSAAKEMQQMSRVQQERTQRVESLKNQVENGTYKQEPKETAKSMLEFFFKK
ncbi:flagellar biosynthesis anti-sigma factor FlgM [Bacillus massilinigeriensis]|uniref:flagellar biosynthesis anti-sigma factor FlgM n=1 Tax=Bacillus mediterraneensis TaxID=1805474 RepID=UPI0008F8852A|nr:flagellar biosynthesis anti-sigma factor FlgM [Bacillus mediterraneensis]